MKRPHRSDHAALNKMSQEENFFKNRKLLVAYSNLREILNKLREDLLKWL